MRKKLLILLCTIILISNSTFASNAKIPSIVDRDEELSVLKLVIWVVCYWDNTALTSHLNILNTRVR